MANSKRKCKHCKEYTVEYIKVPAGTFCSMDHAIEFANNKRMVDAKKSFNKESAKRKRELRLTDLKVRKAAAKYACHKYIRERDRGQPCICCGRPLGDKYDAGHFMESGNYPFIRYHEDNIHAQSVYCNQYKGGDSEGKYEERLIKKIGKDRVQWLKDNKNNPIKRTAEDYLEIENYYKRKLRELYLTV